MNGKEKLLINEDERIKMLDINYDKLKTTHLYQKFKQNNN
jgi:hypothetical protein